MRRPFHLCMACVAAALTACGPQPNNAWGDLDYKSVYQRAKMRELDTFYTQPTDLGCLDDDLYNCN